MDKLDLKINRLLAKNGAITNAEIARTLKLAPSAVLGRIRKLEAAGVIKAYEVRFNARAFGLPLLAFVSIKTNEQAGPKDIGKALSALPNVQEAHHIAGEDCLVAKVRAESPEHLGEIVSEKIGRIVGVHSTKTTIVLSTFKETTALNMDAVIPD